MSLPFANACFEVAVCGLALNYHAWHRPCTVRNAALHVAPAAASRFYVWDYDQGARFLREFWDTALAVDPDAAPFDQARRFPMCTAEGLRDLFAEVTWTT